jgi:hypothetical protein
MENIKNMIDTLKFKSHLVKDYVYKNTRNIPLLVEIYSESNLVIEKNCRLGGYSVCDKNEDYYISCSITGNSPYKNLILVNNQQSIFHLFTIKNLDIESGQQKIFLDLEILIPKNDFFDNLNTTIIEDETLKKEMDDFTPDNFNRKFLSRRVEFCIYIEP